MVDIKHLLSVNCLCSTTDCAGSFPLSSECHNSPAVTFHGGGGNFGKPLTGDYSCLVCWSLLVMWPGRSPHPVLLSHSSLAIFINHFLEIFSAHIPTVIHFYSLTFTALKMVSRFERVSKLVAAQNIVIPWKRSFYPELISFILCWGMLCKRIYEGEPTIYWMPTSCPLLIFSWLNVHCMYRWFDKELKESWNNLNQPTLNRHLIRPYYVPESVLSTWRCSRKQIKSQPLHLIF